MNETEPQEAELARIATLDIVGLRQAWRRHFGAPPRLRSRDLLRRMLAFELQAAAEGGLSVEIKQTLLTKTGPKPRKARVQPGTIITREWRGERHIVTVQDGGFEHLGTRYGNLSEIARTITGVRWSGPRFFGLKDPERKAA